MLEAFKGVLVDRDTEEGVDSSSSDMDALEGRGQVPTYLDEGVSYSSLL